MKHYVFAIVMVLSALTGFAQNVAINSSGAPADASAILDLSSNDKGLLIPRLSSIERTAILNPATGLVVYDTDSRSFWFYAPGWEELLSHGDMGSAGGDLDGTYPEPTVAKLQGHLVSALTPEDKQVLKWDMTDNMWKGMNDSLSLPYAGSAVDPGELFSVSSMFNGFQNNTAIVGRRHNGSTIGMNYSAGIWGDADTGMGVMGTSDTHAGVYGRSATWHGVYGVTDGSTGLAGVYGFSGSGIGVKGEVEDAGIGIYGKTTGQDAIAATFENTNTINDYPVVTMTTLGLGSGLDIITNNAANTAPVLKLTNNGLSNAIKINSSNPAQLEPTLEINQEGANNAFEITTKSRAIYINANDPAEENDVIRVSNHTIGTTAVFGSYNYSDSNNCVNIVNWGQGQAVHVFNGLSAQPTVDVVSLTAGEGVRAQSEAGTGVYGKSFGVEDGVGVYGVAPHGTAVKGENLTADYPAIYGHNTGGGEGVFGHSEGTDAIGVRGVANAAWGTGFGVLALNEGIGDGIRAMAGGYGSGITALDNPVDMSNAGYFVSLNPLNTHETVNIQNSALGTTLFVNTGNNANTTELTRYKNSGTGDFAVYESGNGTHKIRFDNTGKGFFNGGTQTGGADVAEAFDVETTVEEYEPGDVLVISTSRDRTVTKSQEPYSDLVAGVYATKPGVLMTEEEIDADLSDKVPMGVLGVIPTKVCLEGGPIHRGDLLVTSSLPGVAMKADPEKVRPGQVLGKALEDDISEDVNKIRVLVNVR